LRIILWLLLSISFAYSITLPNLKIGFFDEANKSLDISKKADFYSAGKIFIKPNQKTYIKVIFDEVFSSKGSYMLVISGVDKVAGCKDKLSYKVCPIYYDGSKLNYRFDIHPTPHTQSIKKAVVYTSSQYLDFEQKSTNQYFLGMLLVGFILAIIAYALVLFVSLKERLYLYYALMEAGFLAYSMVHLNLFGIANITRVVWVANAISLGFMFVFAVKFLHIKKWCKLIYLGVIYSFVSALAFAFGVFHPFLGSLFVPWILLCAVFEYKRVDVRFFIGAVLVIVFGVIVIEFFQPLWLSVLHPMIVVLPLEAVLMLFAIGYRLKQIKEQKNRYQNLLLHQHKANTLSTLVASIAHRYKTNLSRISFLVMQLQLDKNQANKIALDINDEIKELKEIVNNYLLLYKNNLEKEEKVALEKIFDSILKTIDTKDINISVDIPPQTYTNSPWVIKEIALIAITNSIEALSNLDKKTKYINITYKNNRCYICDNAGGIKDLTRLFDPKLSSKTKGSGIGLYIAKLLSTNYLNSSLEAFNKDGGFCIVFEVC